jgi:hypothetical protein
VRFVESADVPPMPVGPEPQALSVERLAEIAAELGHVAQVAAEATGWRLEDYRAVRGALHSARLLVTEAGLLRARVAELEAERDQLRQLPGLPLDKLAKALLLIETGPALPWAHTMPDDDLHGFLGDLVSAAMGRWQSDPEVPDREVLAAVEKACADWRTPGQGYRSDPEEDGDACTCPPADRPGPHQVGCLLAEVPGPGERPVNGFTAVFVPVASLREPEGEFYGLVHHDYRVSHDLPETGGAS